MFRTLRRRIFAIWVFCILGNILSDINAQDNIIFYPDLYYRVEKKFLKDTSLHSLFHPRQITQEQFEFYTDSLYGNRDKDMWRLGNNNQYVVINPILQSSFSASSSFLQHYVAGFKANSRPMRNIIVTLNYSLHFLTNPSLPGTRLDSAGIVYHWGQSSEINSRLRFLQSLNGIVNFTPIRFLNFQAGKDKHFWGDGYRSLFISDNAPPYPFFATTVKLWRVQYTSMNAFMRDDTINDYSKLRTKYAAMHALSWNVSKRLNVNIFETVIWYKRNDSISHRSFDVTYLNPFIFYRPLEYNLGSPDNVLMGVGFRYLFGNLGMMYGQFLLDEFHYKEIIRGQRWWGNKNAFQVGVKYFGLPNLYVQLEYNQARPFTYTHSYSLQNYGSMLQPLAHPLGTNFREGVLILRYAKGRWLFNYSSIFARYGTEPGGKTVGADIYRSTISRAKDYQNFIGQGITTNELTNEVRLSKVIQARWGLMGDIAIRDAIRFLPEKKHQVYVMFGFKTLLYRDEKLY